ncbi:hypothetical protein QJS04_geneDACA024464 [Acorus gramineus]|uniref:Uncharacterized protein n=1 Tax=Acorus gramineus TaxID=55184 RepID=A0AAV8ZZL3_ACOGR|nr:hypothetical protein QJS04_geneDACA024464 [Acorus gramineus]
MITSIQCLAYNVSKSVLHHTCLKISNNSAYFRIHHNLLGKKNCLLHTCCPYTTPNL